jgi:hypothetical protein
MRERLARAACAVLLLLEGPVFGEQAVEPAQSPFEVDPFEAPFALENVDVAERPALAEALAVEGRAAVERREWEQAARSFEVSYRLRQDAGILLPLARALERIRRYAAAAERLERYLAEAAALSEQERAALEQELRAMRRQFARVTVRTAPEGALVSIDGRSLGESPLGSALLLDHGNYLLEAHLEGFADGRQELAVAGGRELDVLIELAPLRAAGRHGPRWTSALEVALWTTVGLAAASAIALAATGGVALDLWGDLEQDPDRGPEETDRLDGLLGASYGLIGVTAAAAVAAVTLAVLRTVGGGDAAAD